MKLRKLDITKHILFRKVCLSIVCILALFFLGINSLVAQSLERTESRTVVITNNAQLPYIIPPIPNQETLPPIANVTVTMDVHVVGGGGGGGRGQGAGGGGGGQITSTSNSLIVSIGQLLTGTIGAGGAGGATNGSFGSNGQRTTFAGLEANGGQGGGAPTNNGVRNGGNSGNNRNGGNKSQSGNNRAGGGGAGAVDNGLDGEINGNSVIGGNGGEGRLINGNFYGAGGGGSARRQGSERNTIGGLGGNSVGGNGAREDDGIGQNAVVNTGSGGGAGSEFGIAGNGSNGAIILTITYSIILPVNFEYVKASFQPENTSVNISWATAKEWENSHFEIERAIDQVDTFETIGEKEGMGYSDEAVNYSYQDKRVPLAGGMAYYRLKQVDFDGSFTYSEIVGVRIPGQSLLTGVWRAFPNPAKAGDRFNIELVNRAAYDNEVVVVKLISPLGMQQNFTGKDLRQISDNISQSFQKSTNGLYIVEITWGTQKELIKVMKN